VTKNYTTDLKEALGQLLLMASEREQLETKIAKQKKRVAALYELVQADDDSLALSGLVEGITDACRVVFRSAEKPLSAGEVRDRVQALGLPPQANLLASIHTTIKRMREAGEIAVHPDANAFNLTYTWVTKTLKVSDLLGQGSAALEAFKKVHDAKLAREKAAHDQAIAEMREGGSEVGESLSIENTAQRSEPKAQRPPRSRKI
jgi:hypothetical protein